MSSTIYHIITPTDWEKVQSQPSYSPPSLKEEGFIHFSTKEQILKVANSFFSQYPKLSLMEIETQLLNKEIIFERAEGLDDSFPHLYCPLNMDAVVRIHTLEKNDHNLFELPLTIEEKRT